jgi:site-specific DNA recombinase
VQTLLDEKRVAGERPQKHHHYLRGSVFCGDCGRRLIFGISTGKAGKRYPYYFCSARAKHTACTQRANIRPELIEAAIQRHYRERPVQLTPKDVAKRTEAIEALASVSQQAVIQVKAAKSQLIAELKAQQGRLLRLHTEEGDDVSPDAFRDERARLQTEVKAAEQSLAETEQRLQLDTDMLRMALELAGDVAGVYATANQQAKRSLNQAFFTRLYVLPDWDQTGSLTARISHSELTEPYTLLLAKDLVPNALSEVGALRAATPQTESGSVEPPSGAGLAGPPVSIFDYMAGATGLEPATSGVTGRRSNQLSYAPA